MSQPYYDIGKATLTAGSDIMTGQGTLWIGNARPGDQVVSYSNHTAIVGEVVSNTQIKLKRPYRGTNQAAQVYEILYTPDDPYTQTIARGILHSISRSALVKLGSVTPAARQLVRFDENADAALTAISDYVLGLLAAENAATARKALGANDAKNLTEGVVPDASLPAHVVNGEISLLADSGRFAGDAAKDVAVTAFNFPSYLTLLNGTSAASAGKFIHENNDYGGIRGALPPMIKSLIDKIRSPVNRRYGTEFFAAELTMGTGTLYPIIMDGINYYYSMQLTFGPRMPTMTFHTYLRALDASIGLALFAGQRIIKNGIPQAGQTRIDPSDGWVSIAVNDQVAPYFSNGYQPMPLNIHVQKAGQRYLMACPALMSGIVQVDPNVGVIAGINRWL